MASVYDGKSGKKFDNLQNFTQNNKAGKGTFSSHFP
jgi:hypothetical protein